MLEARRHRRSGVVLLGSRHGCCRSWSEPGRSSSRWRRQPRGTHHLHRRDPQRRRDDRPGRDRDRTRRDKASLVGARSRRARCDNQGACSTRSVGDRMVVLERRGLASTCCGLGRQSRLDPGPARRRRVWKRRRVQLARARFTRHPRQLFLLTPSRRSHLTGRGEQVAVIGNPRSRPPGLPCPAGKELGRCTRSWLGGGGAVSRQYTAVVSALGAPGCRVLPSAAVEPSDQRFSFCAS